MENNMIAKYWSYMLIALFLAVCAGYVGINGENIVIQIYDNLNSNIAWLKMLSDNDLFFNYHDKVPFLHGLDRMYLYSPLKAYVWLYMIFPTFWAFVIGWFLKIIISVAGFIYLGKALKVDADDFNKNIIAFCGFLYGLTPTFPTSAFCFASLPFLLGFLVQYYKTKKFKYNLYLLAYPIFSDFCFFGIFVMGYIVLFVLIDWWINKKFKLYMLSSLVCLTIGYVISEWSLFYVMLFAGEPSIRDEIVSPIFSFADCVKYATYVFIFGHYHSASAHTFVVLPVCLLYWIYLIIKKRTEVWRDFYFWIVLMLFVNAAMFGFNYAKPVREALEVFVPPLKGFDFSRFLWLNAFLWYLAFCLALLRINIKFRYIADMKICLCVYAFMVLVCDDSIYNFVKYNYDYQTTKNESLAVRQGVRGGMECFDYIETNREVTYAQFYSEKLFNRIKKAINYDNEWSVAYGFHPAVLQYNNIRTLDGMLTYYPLNYKREFRKLIKQSLDKYLDFRGRFDTWGGQAYVFSKDIPFQLVNTNDTMESDLLLNPEVFKQMGGKYIFSRLKLSNADELKLTFVDVFKDNESPYTIYVYKAGD